MTSTQRSTLRATSAMASRSPSGELVWSTKIALPPMVLMPASKLSRVRRLAFSNISTICRASSAWRYSRGLRLTSWPSLRMARTSPLERSPIEQRSSPASRAAAARISGSFCTGMETSRRSIVALLATVFSSCGGCGGVCSMFDEDFVEGRDRCVHMLVLQNVGRQETQNRVAGAVDNDAALEHFRHGELSQFRGIHFGGQHQALAPHVYDALVFRRQRAEPLLEVTAHVRRMRQQSFAFDRIDHRDAHRAGQRPASERRSMHPRVNGARGF